MANNDSIKFAMHKTAMDYMCGLANYLQNLLNGGKISYEELVYETDPLYVQASRARGSKESHTDLLG